MAQCGSTCKSDDDDDDDGDDNIKFVYSLDVPDNGTALLLSVFELHVFLS